MYRWTAFGMGLLLLGAIVLVLLRVPGPQPATNTAAAEPSIVASSEPADPKQKQPGPDAGVVSDSGPNVDPFDRLPDGGSVPPLPPSVPNSVTFGVILFSYQGAQYAPPDAPDKEVAHQKAIEVLAQAKEDFAEAVKKGDPGSSADAGRIPRGILEPALQYILFTMDPGSVYGEPVDTPRGFWVLRRNK